MHFNSSTTIYFRQVPSPIFIFSISKCQWHQPGKGIRIQVTILQCYCSVQARAIHELAKKVFRLLKTDPEEFEQQFSGTRRRSTRKLTKPENCRAPFSNKSFQKTSSNTGLEGAIGYELSNTAHCFTGAPSQSKSVQIGSTVRESSNGRRQTGKPTEITLVQFSFQKPQHC